MNTAEFSEQFSAWRLVNTGRDNLVAVRDFTDKDGAVRAVGVSRDAVVVYAAGETDAWDFYRSDSIYAVDNGGDLTSLEGLFSAGERKEIGVVSAWLAGTQRA